MTDHTPTPWSYRPARHDDWGWIRGPKLANSDLAPLVAIARSGEWETLESNDRHREAGTDPCGANAAFIIKAVNNHDALVKALQRVLRFLDEGTDYELQHPADYSPYLDAKAILDAVGTQQPRGADVDK